MNWKRLSLCFLLGRPTGCASVQSTTNNDAIPTFNRILVASKLPNVSDRYVVEYLNAFPQNYPICPIAISPLSFEKPNDIIQREMYTYPGNQPFWRALITTPSRRNSLRNCASLPPRLLLNRLRKDGIIVGKTPNNSAVANQ